MIEPDRSGGYIALFSEIGFTLFLMTLGGAGLGIWAGTRAEAITTGCAVMSA